MRVPSAVTFALCSAALLATSACGGEEPAPRTLDLDATEGQQAPDPTSAPTAGGDEPVDGELRRGGNVAKGATQMAVAEVWYAYWTEVYRTYTTTKADRDAMYRLATDAAAAGPLDYAADMKEAGLRQAGGGIAAVTSIDIQGNRAVVESCFRNSAVNVDRKGDPVEEPLAFFTTRETLEAEGPDWRVVRSVATSERQECDFR